MALAPTGIFLAQTSNRLKESRGCGTLRRMPSAIPAWRVSAKIAAFTLLIITLLGAFVAITWRHYTLTKHTLTQQLPTDIASIVDLSQTDQLAQRLVYYDEVQSQSAANYLRTGDALWRERYEAAAAGLAELAQKLPNDSNTQSLQASLAARQTAADLERAALDNTAAARELTSDNYRQQRERVTAGVTAYLATSNTRHRAASRDVDEAITSLQHTAREAAIVSSVALACTLIISVVGSMVLTTSLNRPLRHLVATVQRAAGITPAAAPQRASSDHVQNLSAAFTTLDIKLQHVAARQAHHEQSHRTLENLPQPVLVVDRAGTIVAANRAAGHLMNRPHTTLVGQRAEQVGLSLRSREKAQKHPPGGAIV